MEEDVELLDEFAAMEAIAKQIDAGKVSIKVIEPPKLVYSTGSIVKCLIPKEVFKSHFNEDELTHLGHILTSPEETISGIGKILSRQEVEGQEDNYNVNLIVRFPESFKKIVIQISQELILGQGGEFEGNYLSEERSCKDWEYKEAEKKKRESLDAGVKERIAIIEELAELTHPECWSFQKTNINRKLSDGEMYELIIHMPEVKITNSDKRHIVIKDMFLKLCFNAKIEHVGRLYGTRLSLSYNEVRTGYVHSHLPGTREFKWQGFCLGGGDTKTSELILGLSADRWNPDNLRSLLILLYGFTSWESLEGGPHVRMSTINSQNNRSLPSLNGDTLKNYYKQFIRNGCNIPIQLERNGIILNYKIDSRDPMYIKDILGISEHKVIRNPNGSTSNYTPNAGNISDSDLREASSTYRGKLEFKGEILEAYIYRSINEQSSKIDESTLEPAPQVIDHITKTLEKEINKYQLKRNLL
jgi:hypothetical protein